jgi:hypothetical protein
VIVTIIIWAVSLLVIAWSLSLCWRLFSTSWAPGGVDSRSVQWWSWRGVEICALSFLMGVKWMVYVGAALVILNVGLDWLNRRLEAKLDELGRR